MKCFSGGGGRSGRGAVDQKIRNKKVKVQKRTWEKERGELTKNKEWKEGDGALVKVAVLRNEREKQK